MSPSSEQATRNGSAGAAQGGASQRRSPTEQRLRLIWITALGMASLSGLAGLAHQILWTRRLVDLLGASPMTFAKVIGAFFIGLAAGSAVAALYSKWVRRPWRWVALAEIGVAVLALPPVLVPAAATWLDAHPEWSWIRPGLPFLLIVPPALGMGLVMPWLIRAIPLPGGTKPVAVWLYAANTLGGVLGVVVILLLILPAVGLNFAAGLVCGVNIIVAALALAADGWAQEQEQFHPVLRSRAEATERAAAAEPAFPVFGRHGRRSAGLLAFASGFLVLGLEVVAQQQFAQVSINSFFSSATVLVWVLLALAAGAALVPWLSRRARSPGWLLVRVLLVAGALGVSQPFIFTWVRDGVTILPYELPPVAYGWEMTKLALVALAPTFLAAGIVFPLLLLQATSNGAVTKAKNIAFLLAWNGVGGWVGAEVTQGLIVPQGGLWRSAMLLAGGYLVLGCYFSQRWPGADWGQVGAGRLWRWAFPAGAMAGLGVAFWWGANLPVTTLGPGERLAAVAFGREGVVATVECAPGDWRMLFNNSYTLGGSRAQSNQERQAHIPLLLHGSARSVAVLGVATGSTVAGAALHPSVERIDAAELSPLVLAQAREFFAPYNRNVFADPRVHVVAEDARRLVAAQEHAYDVIIGDLFLPWRTGEARLYSREHFRAVRRALQPDGVFCQWLPLFQLTRPQFEAIARTFQQVFPDGLLVRGDFYTEYPIIGLVGGREVKRLDWARIAERCAELREQEGILDPLVRHEEGVAMTVIGTLPELEAGPINTLAAAWLEWDCGRNILGMKTPWFIGVPAAEFVRDVQRAANPQLPETLRRAHESGQFFLTLEIAAKLRLEAYPNLLAQVPARLPQMVRSDPLAQWQEWPSRVKPSLP